MHPQNAPPGIDVDSLLSEVIDEYLQHLASGGIPDLEEYAQKYPEIAEQIRLSFPALELVGATLCSSSHAPQTAGLQGTEEQRLGDFRIGAEVGRGGMGIVYEAEQISMGRKVALKVLPFAAVMDEKAITRFKNEARAAGTLHHDNIVPVHAVGSERGVYFYAMSLIQGITLAELVMELKQRLATRQENEWTSPLVEEVVTEIDRSDGVTHNDARHSARLTEQETTRLVQGTLSTHRSLFDSRFFRQVARIGADTADALHHAHEHGIVHRDVKPGNLMVDANGKVWITDFGLARIDADAGMTMTGDLLGTLRYMAPEQALAKRAVVDHRADIYSLGVTLYEMLTLRPAYDGRDRKELLKQLAFEEPKPIRYFHPDVPIDLETIILKAIEKNPEERYVTAEELAHDLRAFHASRPIKAKPLTPLQRSRRWASRHLGMLVAATIVLLIGTLGLAGAVIAIAQEQSETKVALESAQRNLERAETNFERAREAVDTYLTRVSEDQLLNEPGLQSLRKDLLELALKYYQQFIDERADDPELQLELADALDRVNHVRWSLGLKTEGGHDRALEIRQQLFDREPDNTDYRDALAKSYTRIYASHTLDVAIERLQIAVEIAEPLSDSSQILTLANALVNLGAYKLIYFEDVGGTEKLEESHTAVMRAIEILEREVNKAQTADDASRLLSEAYETVARWHGFMGNQADEDRLRRLAIDIRERLHAANPRSVKLRSDLIIGYWNAGAYEQSIGIAEKLADEHPRVIPHQRQLAELYGKFGGILLQQGQHEQAVNNLRKSIDVWQRIYQSQPAKKKYLARVGVENKSLARALRKAGKLEEAVASCETAIRILTETGLFRGVLADAYAELSRTLEYSGRLDEAIEARRGSVKACQGLPTAQLHFQTSQAWQHKYLGDLLDRAERKEAAVVEYRNAVSVLEPKFSADDPDGTPDQITSAHRALVTFQGQLAGLLGDLGKHEEAADVHRKALAMETRFLRERPQTSIEDREDAYFRVVDALEMSGRRSEAEPFLREQLSAWQGLQNMGAQESRHLARQHDVHCALAYLRGMESREEDAERAIELARNALHRAIRMDPAHGSDWKRWNRLSLNIYRSRNWEGVGKEARVAIESSANDPNRLLYMAPLLLLAGENEEYGRLCLSLLKQVERIGIDKHMWVVRLCTLDTRAVGVPERVLTVAESAQPSTVWEQYALGRAAYRAGQYGLAIASLEKALRLNELPSRNERQLADLIKLDLALAHYYSGNEQPAHAWLERVGVQPSGINVDLHLHGHTRMEIEVLRAEAHGLITGKERPRSSNLDES